MWCGCFLNKFKDGHLGVISRPGHGAQNTAVSSIPFPIALRSLLKESTHEVLVVHVRKGLSPGVKGSPLGELNHVVYVLACSPGPGVRGGDATVANHLCGESAEESLTLIRGLVELLKPLSVALYFMVLIEGERGGGGGGGGGGGRLRRVSDLKRIE